MQARTYRDVSYFDRAVGQLRKMVEAMLVRETVK